MRRGPSSKIRANPTALVRRGGCGNLRAVTPGRGEATMSHPDRHGRDDLPTTQWANVRRAGAEASPGQRLALDELLRRYWPALVAHLVYKKKMPRDRAEDVVQSFVQEKVLQRNLVQLADPGKGRFRTFLLTALDRF